MPDEGWSLTLRFPDQSPAFSCGFTCGRLWEQMRTPGCGAITTMVMSDVRETVEAMAMALGWIEEIRDVTDGWIEVTLTKPEGDDGRDARPPIVPQLSP